MERECNTVYFVGARFVAAPVVPDKLADVVWCPAASASAEAPKRMAELSHCFCLTHITRPTSIFVLHTHIGALRYASEGPQRPDMQWHEQSITY